MGQSVIDRIRRPRQASIERLGGSPLFAGQALAMAGLPAVILTRGATPELRRPLHALGFPVIEGPARSSCVSVMDLRDDGTRSDGFLAFGEPFTPADVRGWMARGIRDAHAVVCGAQWEDDFSPETLAALAAGGRPVYLDGQGPLRPRRLGPVHLKGPLRAELMRPLTVLKLAEEEASTALVDVGVESARALDVPVVAVTLGHHGAVIITATQVVEVGVEPVRGLADTVGAGDAFLALMAARQSSGATLALAAQLACADVTAMLRRRLASEDAGTRGPGTAPEDAGGASYGTTDRPRWLRLPGSVRLEA